jgi:hypothetical protein
MDKFIAELQNNPEFKAEFIAYMHKEEARISESFKVIYDNLNKQVMASIKAFADEKGITLQDSEAVSKQCAAQCRAMADQMNKLVIEQFKKF